jgi:hypothetical protein
MQDQKLPAEFKFLSAMMPNNTSITGLERKKGENVWLDLELNTIPVHYYT